MQATQMFSVNVTNREYIIIIIKENPLFSKITPQIFSGNSFICKYLMIRMLKNDYCYL